MLKLYAEKKIMHTQRHVLFVYKEDIESKLTKLCCSGQQKDFNDFRKHIHELKEDLDADSLIHGAILAIHYDNIDALKYFFEDFSKILETKIEALLTAAANHNKTQCIEYLLQQRGANPKALEDSSAYSNFEGVKRLFDEQQRRLSWAMENKNNDNYGIKANALYILHAYYLGGWCGIAQDRVFAKKCLQEAAELGHGKAICDFTRDVLFTSEIEQAKQYICQALLQNKLNDINFDYNSYKQESMKEEIESLLGVIESISSKSQNSVINKGDMEITDKGVEFDDLELYGLELKGRTPLSPRTKMFLESKGNSVTQSNGKIFFNGDFFNTFSQKEVTDFIAQKLIPKLRPW